MFTTLRIRTARVILALLLTISLSVGGLLLWSSYRTQMSSGIKEGQTEGIRLPIVMYHSILGVSSRQGQYVVSPEVLENDLKFLKDKGYTTIVTEDLVKYVKHGVLLPEKPIMLTFDDGFYNNYLNCMPLMEKYDCKMILSPIGAETVRYSESGEENVAYSYVTWKRLKEMHESGRVEIQNHSYNMHSAKGGRNGSKKKSMETLSEYQSVFSEDVLKMQNLITEQVGVTPTAFAYPLGAISKESLPILKELGFQAAFTCESKVNVLTGDGEQLYHLGRYNRPAGISTEAFFAKFEKS